MPTKVEQVFPDRVQLEALAGRPSASVGVTIKSGFKVKQGDVVGKITTGGKYRRRSRTLAAGSGFATNSTVGAVEDASVFAPGDVLTTSSGTAIGTVAVGGVNEEDDEVTLTANAANAVASGTAVIATDGSAVARGISDWETDGTADVAVAVIISGKLTEGLLRGLDASARTELAGASVAGDIFKF